MGRRAFAIAFVVAAVSLYAVARLPQGMWGWGYILIHGVMAVIMVIYRRYPATPGAGPQALQSLLLLPVAATLGQPFSIEATEILILAAFGLLFAIASVTLAEGAKRVPSGQTALLSSLETPLAPILAFLLFAEVPAVSTFLGGLLVVLAVVSSITRGT